MNSIHDPADWAVIEKLDKLKPTPARNALAAARGRARFLSEAETLRQPVSASSFWRHIGRWNPIQQKERAKMAPLIALLVAASLGLGSGAAIYAAQEAMPDDALYAVKLTSEEAQLSFGDANARTDLALAFSNRRVQEMMAMIAQGSMPPTEVFERRQRQVEMAMRIAAGMDDAALQRELVRIRETLTLQLARMTQTQSTGTGSAQLAQARERVRTQLALIELGLEDPQLYRTRVQERARDGVTEPLPGSAPKPTVAEQQERQNDQDRTRQRQMVQTVIPIEPSRTPGPRFTVTPQQRQQQQGPQSPTGTLLVEPPKGTPQAQPTAMQQQQQLQQQEQQQSQEQRQSQELQQQQQQQQESQEQQQQQQQEQQQQQQSAPGNPVDSGTGGSGGRR